MTLLLIIITFHMGKIFDWFVLWYLVKYVVHQIYEQKIRSMRIRIDSVIGKQGKWNKTNYKS